MTPTSLYPVICATDTARAAAFLKDHFGFASAFDSGWYVHLISTANPDRAVAIVDHSHGSVPPGGRKPVRGVLLTLEYDEIDSLHERIAGAGVRVVTELRDEPWGQRHFIVEGPDGLLVDVVKPIEPAPEFAQYYQAPGDNGAAA